MVFNLFFGTILIFLVFNIPFWLFCVLVFAWGSGAGVVISMSRTITQTFARETHRGRILSIYSLAIFFFWTVGSINLWFYNRKFWNSKQCYYIIINSYDSAFSFGS